MSKPTTTAELTPDEARIIAAYRTMDDRHKGENRLKMRQDAEIYPARPRVALRLVRGSA